jgi:hypothetical protein
MNINYKSLIDTTYSISLLRIATKYNPVADINYSAGTDIHYSAGTDIGYSAGTDINYNLEQTLTPYFYHGMGLCIRHYMSCTLGRGFVMRPN